MTCPSPRQRARTCARTHHRHGNSRPCRPAGHGRAPCLAVQSGLVEEPDGGSICRGCAHARARRQATRPLRRRGSPRSPPGRHPARHSIDRFPGNCRPQRGGPRTSRERSSPTTSGDGARHRRRRGRAPAQQTATATTRPHARGTGRRRVGRDDAAWDGTVIEATGPRIAQTGRWCARAARRISTAHASKRGAPPTSRPTRGPWSYQ